MIELINSYIQIVTNGAFDEIAFPLICKNSIGEVCTIEDSEGHKILAANDLDVIESRALAVLITTLLNQHHKELSTLTILKSDEQSVIGDKNSDTTTTETTITSSGDGIVFPLRHINGLHTSTIKDSNNRVLKPTEIIRLIDEIDKAKALTTIDLNFINDEQLTMTITELLNNHYTKKHKDNYETPIVEVSHKDSDIECANCKFSKRTDFLLPNNIKESVIRCHLNPPQVVVDHFEYPKVATISNGFTWELGVCSEFEIDQVKLG